MLDAIERSSNRRDETNDAGAFLSTQPCAGREGAECFGSGNPKGAIGVPTAVNKRSLPFVQRVINLAVDGTDAGALELPQVG